MVLVKKRDETRADRPLTAYSVEKLFCRRKLESHQKSDLSGSLRFNASSSGNGLRTPENRWEKVLTEFFNRIGHKQWDGPLLT